MSSEANRLNSQRLGELMHAAQDGNRASYDLLLREIVPVIRGFIRTRSRFLSQQDVEDVAQDTLLSVIGRGRPMIRRGRLCPGYWRLPATVLWTTGGVFPAD